MKVQFRNFLVLLVSTVILMIPAIYNGFPLVYTDTGTYILSGMELSIPLDRPVMYGLFIRLASFQQSLWLVIFFQCLILSHVLWFSFRLFTNVSRINYRYLFVVAILVAFTSLGWYAGQLMPDIFTAVAILCTLLLLFYKRYSYPERFFLAIILIFSEGVHFSNFVISIGLLIVAFILSRIKAVSEIRTQLRFLVCALVLFTGVGVSSLVNYSIGGVFRINQGSHVFLTGRLLDHGVLKKFLDEKCATNDYTLCAFKDSLPEDSRVFMWDAKSPVYKNGGWKETSYEYNRVIKGMLTSPKYIGILAYYSVIAGCSQLLQNEIGSGLVTGYYASPDSPPYTQVALHFPHELNQYRQSRQNINLWEQGLDFSIINGIYYVLLVLTVLFLFTILSVKTIRGNIPLPFRFFFMTVIAGIVVNAFAVGALASVCDRFQGRVSWFFVYLAILTLINYSGLIRGWLRGKSIKDESDFV